MKFEKVVEQLNHYLSRGERKKHAKCDRIDDLLQKLEEKKKKLEKKLEREKNPTRKKRMNTELKVIALQLKNGTKRREELTKKCR